MSTITTVFGLMPLVLSPGAGSEFYRGLGSVVIGGLFYIDSIYHISHSGSFQPCPGWDEAGRFDGNCLS
jgi:hypothetical protein